MRIFKSIQYQSLLLSLLANLFFIPGIVHTAQLVVPYEEIVQTADLIFIGTVENQSCRFNESHTMIFTDVSFKDIIILHATDKSVQKGLPINQANVCRWLC
jgi:hypothetical protein